MDTIIWLDGYTSKISSKEAKRWGFSMQITKFNIYGRIHSLYSRAYKRQETTSL